LGRGIGEHWIYRTTDGGDTWNQQVGPNYMLNLDFVDANIGTAVGAFGIIMHTTTGGE
jgi:photosystem II stability/assembly factor-like uncharacterized protein